MSAPSPLAVTRALLVVSGGPVALLLGGLLGPVALLRRWTHRVSGVGARRAARLSAWTASLAPWLYLGVARPLLMNWGSTPQERLASYPGDVEDPLFTTTRAVTVRAPAPEVWAWLVQIGQDRGGFYSYDWLENLAGCHVHSATRIHPAWQDVRAGDPLTLFPGYATTFEVVDPPHTLLIANWGAYVVVPRGPHQCRLVARCHAARGLPGLAYALLIELPHAIMERKMLLGIKQRAEESHRLAHPDTR